MCMSRPKVPAPKQAPAPVVNQSPIGEDLAPQLVTADEQDAKLKRKKLKNQVTSALNTTSGVKRTSSGSGLNIS